eukprot:gene35586-67164_t
MLPGAGAGGGGAPREGTPVLPVEDDVSVVVVAVRRVDSSSPQVEQTDVSDPVDDRWARPHWAALGAWGLTASRAAARATAAAATAAGGRLRSSCRSTTRK